ncbi:MAG: hypothetical protein NDJ92_18865 [Thermoanaerobaculia bacterium]|nr:hypothetical protein [Thermoanaerobaculia bacterium]
MPAGQTTPFQCPATVVKDWDDTQPILEPTYVRGVPQKDAWGQVMGFRADDSSYYIRSGGKGGVFEADT